MANIRITDKQTVTPTGSDFMLINQAGSDKNTTLSRLKTYMNGSTALETEAQDTNSAINEVNIKAANASTGINGIKNTIGSGTLETTSQNLIGAVNEINTRVGAEKLETIAENCTGAINELKEGVDNNTQSLVDVNAQLNAKVNKSQISNNVNTTEEGYVADARALKTINDKFGSCIKTDNNYGNSVFGDDLNEWLNGIYSTTNATTNVPLSTDGWGVAIQLYNLNNLFGIQFFYAFNSNKIYLRYKRGTNIFGEWKEIYS